MSSAKILSDQKAPQLRGNCLCLHLQRAARTVARRFDQAFGPLDLTSGQFSLMMSLSGRDAPSIGYLSALLAMDRTTRTANLKPLERRGLVTVKVDEFDKRARRLSLTPAGRAMLDVALPIWRETHAAVESLIGMSDPDHLRADLRALS